MISISGKIKLYPRVALPELVDPHGVYDLSREDLKKNIIKIKGVLKATLNGEYLPYGLSGFYHCLSPTTGVKVFYSLHRFKSTASKIDSEYTNVRRCHELGFSVRPLGVEDVCLGVTAGDRRIDVRTKGIMTRRVNTPLTMRDFAVGEYYDFDCLDREEHPLHSPQGYKAFRQSVTDSINRRDMIRVGVKLGDIIYCMTDKRWYLVDCGRVR